MKQSLRKLGLLDKPNKPYSFDHPKPLSISKFINNFTAIDFVFNDPEKFMLGYNLSGLGNGYSFMMAIDERQR